MLQPRSICAVTTSVLLTDCAGEPRARRTLAVKDHSFRPSGCVSGVGPTCGRNDDDATSLNTRSSMRRSTTRNPFRCR